MSGQRIREARRCFERYYGVDILHRKAAAQLRIAFKQTGGMANKGICLGTFYLGFCGGAHQHPHKWLRFLVLLYTHAMDTAHQHLEAAILLSMHCGDFNKSTYPIDIL